MISGDNSIINMAGNAKEGVVIEEEKEQIALAYTLVDEAEVTDKLLKEQLQKNGNNVTVSYSENASSGDPAINLDDYVFEGQEELLVEFNDTHHKYLVDVEGNVSNNLDNVSNSATDWAKINYEIRTDDEGKQYCVVTGLKSGSSKTSLTKINIAKTYKGVAVTAIENNAFKNCNNVKQVVISKNITTICEGAFASCKNITEIIIPDSVINIQGNISSNGAFAGCVKLEKITFGRGIKTIGACVFSGCTSLEHIKIPESITSFGQRIFENCTKLTKIGVGITEGIELESGITSIPANMFNGCTYLSEVTIPDTVTTIGEGAFRSCKNITEITIPDGVNSILGNINGNGTFADCTNLKKIVFGEQMKTIGLKAFMNDTNLEEIIYKGSSHTTEASLKSAGITSIAADAFYGTKITAE